jgi:hypothetical protein
MVHTLYCTIRTVGRPAKIPSGSTSHNIVCCWLYSNYFVVEFSFFFTLKCSTISYFYGFHRNYSALILVLLRKYLLFFNFAKSFESEISRNVRQILEQKFPGIWVSLLYIYLKRMLKFRRHPKIQKTCSSVNICTENECKIWMEMSV